MQTNRQDGNSPISCMNVNSHFLCYITELEVDLKLIEFGEVIGRGSFSEVHKGKWNGKEVALKKIRIPPGSNIDVSKEISVLRYESATYIHIKHNAMQGET